MVPTLLESLFRCDFGNRRASPKSPFFFKKKKIKNRRKKTALYSNRIFFPNTFKYHLKLFFFLPIFKIGCCLCRRWAKTLSAFKSL